MTDPTTPFVAQLRSRPGVLRVGAAGEPTITVRVQMPEVWDVVRVEAPPSEPVLAVKVRALEALSPGADFHDEFVMKLAGWEVLDENVSLAEAGAVDGSIFLLTNRRRRPVCSGAVGGR
jgi:hypothetical protein